MTLSVKLQLYNTIPAAYFSYSLTESFIPVLEDQGPSHNSCFKSGILTFITILF